MLSFVEIYLCIIIVVVHVQCHVTNYESATVCDGQAQYIRCPSDKAIHVLQGFYGKWSNHDCKGRLPVLDHIPTCNVNREKSTAIVKDMCQGNSYCNLFADKAVFSDPCPKLEKYLYVTYFCSPKKKDKELLKPNPPVNKTPISRQKIEKQGSLKRSVTVCNGDRKLISCDKEQRLRVQYAFYGKMNGRDCHGPLKYRDDSPTCSALDAKYTVQSGCDGKTSCALFADDNNYGRSLCPNVNKYLQVGYKCEHIPVIQQKSKAVLMPEEIEEDPVSRSKINPASSQKLASVRVCNGERKTISCSKTNSMRIVSAIYGKVKGQDCFGNLKYKDEIPTCLRSKADDAVRFLCDGRQSCDLLADSALYGPDPCPGVNKYLLVKYSC